jgi:toxin FitB
MGTRKEIGSPMSVLDAQIAAMARNYNYNLATRNIKDFDNCGIDLINPFDYR